MRQEESTERNERLQIAFFHMRALRACHRKWKQILRSLEAADGIGMKMKAKSKLEGRIFFIEITHGLMENVIIYHI